MASTPPALGARLALAAASLLWSGNSAFIKGCALTSWQVASFRSGVGALVFLALLPEARRWPSARAVAVGAAYAGTMMSFALANKLTTGASAVFLQATAPLWVMALAPWRLGEHASRRDGVAMAFLAAGMALFFVSSDPPSTTAPAPLAGNALGLVSGVTWALTVIGFRRLRMTEGAGGGESAVPSALVMGNVIAFAGGLVPALPVHTVRLEDVAIVAWLGAMSIALAYVLFTRGLRQVAALEASLICLLEPVLNPMWTWLAHGERPNGWSLVGGAVILGTTTVKTWLDTRDLARAAPDAAG
ncbi:MAG: EamA family transporter [Deltaproteobacteria bacterium]|nr:EamA family transporter [Deltaproteobacteria bacterium]